ILLDKRPKLGILLKFIHNAIETDCNSMLKEMNLTSTQIDVLMYLLMNQDHEVNQKDVENEFKIKNPTVTGILKRLESKGLVQRAICQDDGRYKQIIVTDKSREMEKKIHQKVQLIDEKLADGFSLEEQEQLGILLERVLKNLS
ncbi:MAG: MarR family winged helix-turn-helix transcriptional regulator, partial [Acetanaerobacterium sp.]